MLQADKSRIYCFDNLKFILIFLVVFGHLLEIAKGWGDNEVRLNLYRLIYSFHMPVFLFVSGWFAKFRREKIVFHLLYMYVFFQIVYQIFRYHVLEEIPMKEIEYQFTTPYWLLWYLFAIICYHLLIPLLDVNSGWKQILVLVFCFLLALWSGNDNTVGYYFSLGRIFSFLPFFMMGYYGQKWKQTILAPRSKLLILPISVAAGSVAYYVMHICELPQKAFYGSLSYDRLKIELVDKWVLLMIGLFGVLFFVFAVMPLLNFRIPLVSTIGQNSLSVFLLHGFVIRYMQKEEMGELLTPGYTIVIALLIIVILGNAVVGKLFRWICTGWWLEKIYVSCEKKIAE